MLGYGKPLKSEECKKIFFEFELPSISKSAAANFLTHGSFLFNSLLELRVFHNSRLLAGYIVHGIRIRDIVARPDVSVRTPFATGTDIVTRG